MSQIYKTRKNPSFRVNLLSHILTQDNNFSYNPNIQTEEIVNTRSIISGHSVVKSTTPHYVSNRVLKLNVGFLINDGPGHSQDSEFDVPPVRVADDLDLAYIKGPIRLSRNREGILVQGHLRVGLTGECYRCLDPVEQEVLVDIEELYTYPVKVDAEFCVHEDGILDLAPLLRAEVLIETSRGKLCREDCKGLCPECGTNLNHTTCDCHLNALDPRLAQLREMLDRK